MTNQEFEHLDTVEIYADDAGEWRWRRKATGNHEIIATSGEGYLDEDHCLTMATRVNGNCHYVHVGQTVTG